MRNQFPETPLDAALLSMPQYVASSPLRAMTMNEVGAVAKLTNSVPPNAQR